ncbi:hypothetical protein [Kordia zhangzhouensis]|uniref:hypothetical protein n=1 Tax=Kordia zhangzhouensis TaxID=1620405 RepID=UPI000629BF22|nr:hypothetical protein [Kordia zhangzhouensis]
MKFLFYVFSIVILANGCNDGSSKELATKSAQDNITIEYEASSRGFYQKVNLSKENFLLTNTRDGKNTIQQNMTAEDWKEIIQLLDKIDAEKLKNNYVNPDDLGRDAVIPALLTINYKENVVTNVEFGHGNPPKELDALMTKIEAMINAVDKP